MVGLACKKAPKIDQIFVRDIFDSNITNNFYHNILDWSRSNLLAFGQEEQVKAVRPSNSEANNQTLLKMQCPVTALKFCPFDPLLAIGGEDSLTRILDIQKEKKINMLKGHVGKINSIDWFGDLLAIGSKEGVISVRDRR